MRTVLLHGLGQTAADWDGVIQRLPSSGVEIECPELFAAGEGDVSYPQLLAKLEQRYAGASEPLRMCGLSLGALLALDFTLRHGDAVRSLVLIGAQYKVPRLLIDLQNILFRRMPEKSFAGMGLSKGGVIGLTRSMRSLDFTDQLSRITCPVTIVCGERDRANLGASKRLAELLPQAKLRIIPGAGHEVNKSAPQELAAVLSE